MSEEIEKRYGISKELADKIDREYDELFCKDNAKIGFTEMKQTQSQLQHQIKFIERYKYTGQMKVWADNIRRSLLKKLLKLQIKEFKK